MSYINTATGAYPLSADDVRADFPNTSFPASAAGFEASIARSGYVLVQPTPVPAVDHTKTVTEGAPTEDQGIWRQVWVVTDATAEEIAERTASEATAVRQERNAKLSECDWTQLQDTPLDPDAKGAWALYRETLRMVPQQPGFPWEINWPPVPGSN